jgi:hypothetical protein
MGIKDIAKSAQPSVSDSQSGIAHRDVSHTPDKTSPHPTYAPSLITTYGIARRDARPCVSDPQKEIPRSIHRDAHPCTSTAHAQHTPHHTNQINHTKIIVQTTSTALHRDVSHTPDKTSSHPTYTPSRITTYGIARRDARPCVSDPQKKIPRLIHGDTRPCTSTVRTQHAPHHTNQINHTKITVQTTSTPTRKHSAAHPYISPPPTTSQQEQHIISIINHVYTHKSLNTLHPCQKKLLS